MTGDFRLVMKQMEKMERARAHLDTVKDPDERRAILADMAGRLDRVEKMVAEQPGLRVAMAETSYATDVAALRRGIQRGLNGLTYGTAAT